MIVVLFVGGQESHESVLPLGETELAYTLPVLRMFVALIQAFFFFFFFFFFLYLRFDQFKWDMCLTYKLF